MVDRVSQLLVALIPLSFVPAFLLRAADDVSIAPNFAVLAVLGLVVASTVTIVIAARRRRLARTWLAIALANLAVLLVAAGSFDWGGGGH